MWFASFAGKPHHTSPLWWTPKPKFPALVLTSEEGTGWGHSSMGRGMRKSAGTLDTYWREAASL